MAKKQKIITNKSTAKMPQLVAPINALDQESADTLYKNQKIVVEHLIEFTKEVLSIKKDMRKIIDEEIKKQFDDKQIMLEALYKRNIVIQNRFIKKGLITREEISAEYEELKKKKKDKEGG